MSSQPEFCRRTFLSLTAAAAAGVGLPSRRAFAASAQKLDFQLSWIKSIQYGGYFAGIDQKTFEKYGVDATFNPGGPNIDPVANVASGQMMIGDRPSGPLVIARDKGIPIKIIGTVFRKSPYSILSLASKPITSIKDLGGKTIAVSTSSQPLVLYLLKSQGIDPSSVNIVPASPDPSALVSGQIDAYSGYVTNQGMILETRGVKIHAINVQELGLPETAGTIYSTEDFLSKNRQLVVNFLKGAIDGWTWALQNPEPTAHMMLDTYGSPGLEFNEQFAEIKASAPYIMDGLNGDYSKLLSIDPALYDKIIDIYRTVGMVKTDFTSKDLCDTSFIEEAQAS